MKIRSRLMLNFSLAFLGVITISSLYILYDLSKAVETSMKTELSQISDMTEREIDHLMRTSITTYIKGIADKNREILEGYNSLSYFDSLSENEKKDIGSKMLLQQKIGKSGYIVAVNAEGIIQVHPNSEYIGIDISNNEFFTNYKGTTEGLIRYKWKNQDEATESDKTLYRSYYEPWDWMITVCFYDSEIKSVLDMNTVHNTIENIKTGKTGYAYLMDTTGTLFSHKTMEGQNICKYDFIKTMLQTKSGVVTYDWEGKEKIVNYRYIKELGLIFAVGSYTSDYTDLLVHFIKVMSVVIIISLLIFIVISYFVSKKITSPISDIVNISANISDNITIGLIDFNLDEYKQHIQPEFLPLIESLDNVISSFRKPLQETITFIEKVSIGEITTHKDENAQGVFKTLDDASNKLTATIDDIKANIIDITTASKSGDLSKRINSTIAEGYWKEITIGVNSLLENILEPINESINVLKSLSNNDLTVRVKGDYKGDHAIIKNSLNSAIENLSNIVNQVKLKASDLNSSSNNLSRASTQMVQSSTKITQETSMVSTATEEITSSIYTIASAVEEASVNSNTVADSANHISSDMKDVSDSITDISQSIDLISLSSKESEKIAIDASNKSDEATKSMNLLGQAASEIGKVTEVIKRIAEQTNLLALNATIEAASAGEAGKGFAVVANEIKELATQSAKAAEDIAKKVTGVQENTYTGIDIIAEVNTIIKKILDHTQGIVKSVDSQSRVTNEITLNVNETSNDVSGIAVNIDEISGGMKEAAHNIGEVAAGAQEVGKSINSIDHAVQENANEIESVSKASQELSSISGELSSIISKFKI